MPWRWSGPPFARIYLLVKLGSLGPALPNQKPVGHGSRNFTFYKFRTMVDGVGAGLASRVPEGDLRKNLLSVPGHKARRRPISSALRTTTTDPAPKFLSVGMGNMSMACPRPDILGIVARWLAQFQARYQVKPEMTGLAWVNGRYNLTQYEELRYHPISRDLGILLKTVVLVLSRKGAR